MHTSRQLAPGVSSSHTANNYLSPRLLLLLSAMPALPDSRPSNSISIESQLLFGIQAQVVDRKKCSALPMKTPSCQALLSRSMLAGSNGSSAAPPVQVTVERGARNSRRLYAAVEIAAPVEVVWGALTDYQGLGNFIPGAWHTLCTKQ